jgi:putative tricarboxylic transport membrane protein
MALLGAITLWASKDFPTLPRQAYGAGTFPMLVGTFLVVLGGALALRGWRQGGAIVRWQNALPAQRILLSTLAVITAVIGYITLSPMLGFPILSLAILTLMIGWLTSGRWWLALSVGVGATLLIWSIFAELLMVPLPLGIIEEVIY